MLFYSKLSQVSFLRTYSIKFLFVAFLGIHIPLIGIIFFIVLSKDHALSPLDIILYTLALTLVATAATLIILNQLIKPIQLAKVALRNYINKGELPALPTNYKDEVGVLLQDIQSTVTAFDQLLQEKKDLVAMLSHDLRTPTITTLDAVRLLKDDPEEWENLPMYLESLEEVGQKQLQLMDSVLMLLKQEERIGKPVEKKQVALAPIIRSTILQLQLPLITKKLQIKQNFSSDLMVHVEPSSFEQVFSNLLINAVKFSHPSQVISIQAEERGSELCLHVKDEGIGFTPSVSQKLFDRFTQYRQVGTAGEATNGIGLYLCQKMMSQQGGRISAVSEGVGKGATFTIHLSKN